MVLTVLTVIGTGLTSLAATDSAQGNLPTTGSTGAVFRAGGNTAQNGSKGRVFRPTDKTESAKTSSNGNVYRPGGNSGYIGPSGSGKVYRPKNAPITSKSLVSRKSSGQSSNTSNEKYYVAQYAKEKNGKTVYHNHACGNININNAKEITIEDINNGNYVLCETCAGMR